MKSFDEEKKGLKLFFFCSNQNTFCFCWLKWIFCRFKLSIHIFLSKLKSNLSWSELTRLEPKPEFFFLQPEPEPGKKNFSTRTRTRPDPKKSTRRILDFVWIRSPYPPPHSTIFSKRRGTYHGFFSNFFSQNIFLKSVKREKFFGKYFFSIFFHKKMSLIFKNKFLIKKKCVFFACFVSFRKNIYVLFILAKIVRGTIWTP